MTTEELLREIEKAKRRTDVVGAYAAGLKVESRESVNWAEVNAAIKKRWAGRHALNYIKTLAWERYEAERTQLTQIEFGGRVYWGKVTDETAEIDGDITYALVLSSEQLQHVQQWLRTDDYDPDPEARIKRVVAGGEPFAGWVRGTGYRSMGGDRCSFWFSLIPIPARPGGVEPGGDSGGGLGVEGDHSDAVHERE